MQNNLIIEESPYTPKIILNTDGYISFIGKSYPENTYQFYRQIFNWLDEYFTVVTQHITIVNIELIYFNSSSSKILFDLFDLFEEKSNDFNIEINWFYDPKNESARESGEDFKEDFEKLKFNLIEKNG